MGKAADNEAIKLRATYFNNLAVGIAVGGVFIPYFAIFGKINEIQSFVSTIINGSASWDDPRVLGAVFSFAGIPLALYASTVFRNRAKRAIANLKD